MGSNSKLTPDQKARLKHMRRMMPKGSTVAYGCGVTVVCVPDGSVTRIYSSVMGEDENHNRPEVGKFYALSRWFNGETDQGFILPGMWYAYEVLHNFGLDD